MNGIIVQLSQAELQSIVKPLLDVLGWVVPVLLGVVGAAGAIWVIFLGVKFARAEEPQDHEKAKNNLKNAIIGYVLIFVLLLALQIATTVFTDWLSNNSYIFIR